MSLMSLIARSSSLMACRILPAARSSAISPRDRTDGHAPGAQQGTGRAGGAQAAGSRVPSTAARATSVRRWLRLRA